MRLSANRSDNLDKMEKFLEKHKLPKITEEIEGLNKLRQIGLYSN